MPAFTPGKHFEPDFSDQMLAKLQRLISLQKHIAGLVEVMKEEPEEETELSREVMGTIIYALNEMIYLNKILGYYAKPIEQKMQELRSKYGTLIDFEKILNSPNKYRFNE